MTMRSGWIFAAIEDAALRAQTLDAPERQVLVARLHERFGVDLTAHAAWDRLSAPTGRQRQDGGELISAYVGKAPCLLFLDGARTVWRFDSGADLLRVLDESPLLECYVCDEAASYLLCWNHHDFVIGWGTASAWVDTLDDA